ncbi:MAG: hypothetical protein HY290_16005 [Planctomycetia bacterium]|nr:hypothetical protein [Planctomycetia bacterium]
MTRPWAARVPADAALATAVLRLEPGIEVLESADGIWLRGDSDDERLHTMLMQLPGACRFDVLPEGELLPAGSRLPKGRLPLGPWMKLKTWARVELPTAAFAAGAPELAPLRLVRVDGESDANLLLTSIADWAAYGGTAPQVRLEKLRFAASPDGKVVVHGNPLPPLPGERHCERAGIATPCGWGWSPAVEPELLHAAWNLGPHDVALVSTDGSWNHIRSDQFARATHCAIRETAAACEQK